VYRSWEFQAGPDEDHLETVRLWDPDSEAGTAPELVTGDKFVPVVGGLTMDPTILIHRHLPLPLCVRGLMLDAGVAGQKGGK
jgi:hypothetical protein